MHGAKIRIICEPAKKNDEKVGIEQKKTMEMAWSVTNLVGDEDKNPQTA